jgi:hypothetical protein
VADVGSGSHHRTIGQAAWMVGVCSHPPVQLLLLGPEP